MTSIWIVLQIHLGFYYCFHFSRFIDIFHITFVFELNMKSKEFVKEVGEITFLFQLFGLFPFSNNCFTKFYTFLSLAIGLGVIISLFGVNSNYAENSYKHVVSFLVFILRVLIPLVSISHTFITKRQQNEIFNIVNTTDNNLIRYKLLMTIDYKTSCRKHKNKVLIFLVSDFLMRTLFIANILISKDYNFFVYWMHCLQSIILSRVRCIQTFFYADVINERIMLIHEKLLQIQRKQLRTYNVVYQEILWLREIYSNLHEISLLVNDCLGWSLCFLIISYAMDYVGNAWLILDMVQKLKTIEALPSALIGLSTLTVIFLLVCHSCERCERNVT